MPLFGTRSSSKRDRSGEELLLELEALNQALQYKSQTRSTSFSNHGTSPVRISESKPSKKHSLHPKPSFKVPFRSTSISCDRFIRPTTKPLHPQQHEKKSPQHRQQHEKKSPQHHLHHERKGIWRWRPFRAISRMIMSSHHRFHIMFSLHVHRIEGLPVPMNGLRLTVRWICKDQGVQTMPSRIFHGTAEFGETLRHQCTVYGTHSANNMSRYDAKPSTLSIVALDVDELELAKHHVDLSSFLPQNHVEGNVWQEDHSHSTSFALLGMVKGSTLIATFSYDLVHLDTVKENDGMHPTAKEYKNASLLTKSLPLSKHGSPLIDLSDPSTFPSFSEPGMGMACLRHNSIEHLNLEEGHAIQDSSMKNRVHEASDLSDSAFSGSFEFKTDVDRLLEDDHQDEFSFPHTEVVTTDSSNKKCKPPLRDEGLLMGFPFSNTDVLVYDNSNHREEEDSTQKQLEQCKSQETCVRHQVRSPTRQWSYDEARFLGDLGTEFDDEVDLIAEEFLNMLGIGFDSVHCNSDNIGESPRERPINHSLSDKCSEISEGKS